MNHPGIDRRAPLLAIPLLAALALPAFAATAVPLGADEAALLREAEARHPGLAAARLDHEATEARRDAAGRLEDPMLELELRDIPRDSPTLSPARAGSTRYLVSQRLPAWGRRGLERSAAGADVARSGAQLDDERLELRRAVREAYARRWYAARALQTLGELDQSLAALERLAQARYATGLVPQQDAIRAAVERTELARRRLELEALDAQSANQLNVALGRGIEEPLAAPAAAPAAIAVPELAALRTRQQAANPALAAARAEAERTRFAEQLVRRSRWPDVTLGVAPIQMGDRLEAWDLMLSLSLPLQRARRHAEERSARLEQQAAGQRVIALDNELAGEVGEAWNDWRSSGRQAQLLGGTLLPQAEANYRSALASYEVAEVDFGTLLESLRQWTSSRLELLDLQLQNQIAAARIARLTGEAP